VILSTHIVDDVADLCSRMAVISHGQVRLAGEPHQAIAALAGKVWQKAMSKAELEHCARELVVLSTRLVGGQTVAHVYSSSDPGEGFRAIEPDCEHAYFHALRCGARAA
jgi:ABC-type multidrug transport system ATPase subunit